MRFCRFSAPSCAILAPPAGGCRFFRTPIVRFYRFSALCCAILVTPAGGLSFSRTPIVRFCRFSAPSCAILAPPCGGCRFFRPPIVRLFSSPRKRGLQKQQTRLFPSFDLTYRILCLNLRKRK